MLAVGVGRVRGAVARKQGVFRLPSTMRRLLFGMCASIVNNAKTSRHQLRQFSRIAFSPKYLLYTNVSLSITLSSLGDTIEQQYEIYTGQLNARDAKRTVHMALSGATVGVMCHYWYRILDHRLPGRSLSIVAKKLLLDQFVCSPVVLATFFVTLGLLEQSSLAEMKDEIREKAWRLYAAEWVIWPPAQIINFYLLPHRFRVLYDNVISLGYDVYTSQVKHGKPINTTRTSDVTTTTPTTTTMSVADNHAGSGKRK